MLLTVILTCRDLQTISGLSKELKSVYNVFDGRNQCQFEIFIFTVMILLIFEKKYIS